MRCLLFAIALLLATPALAESPYYEKMNRLMRSNPECTADAQIFDAHLWDAKQAGTVRKLVESEQQARLQFEEKCIRPLACPLFYVAADTVDAEDKEPAYRIWNLVNDVCNPDFGMPLMNKCFIIAKGADIRLQRERKEQGTGGIEAARAWDTAHSLMMRECIRPLTADCETARSIIDSDTSRAKLISANDPYTQWMTLVNFLCVKKKK